MVSIKEQIILILLGCLIGILFGVGFSDWGKCDTNSVTNWLIAIGTLLLFFIAIYTAFSWKQQEIPKARKYFIDSIVEFDNYIFNFPCFTLQVRHDRTILIKYSNELLERFWKIESAIMYYYQFDDSNKNKIDAKYIFILDKINEFIDLSNDKDALSNIENLNKNLLDILPESYDLLSLVIGKNLTIQKTPKKIEKQQ